MSTGSPNTDKNLVTTADAAAELGITLSGFGRAVKRLGLTPSGTYRSPSKAAGGGWGRLWSRQSVDAVRARPGARA